jgi:hypothetical protein
MKTLLNVLLLFSLILFVYPSCYAINAVASIKKTHGDVKIERIDGRDTKGNGVLIKIPGRRGLVLKDKDLVITGKSSKVTLLFRDGSEVRLFQYSKFSIEQSSETKSAERGFFHNFRLKAGAFWGKFTKKRQKTTIVTPTATCGIKGTIVSLAERDNQLNVSLSAGAIELTNEDEKINLQAGKMVKGITATGSIREKIREIPFRLVIKPDTSRIRIPTEGNKGNINFTVQLINAKTKQNVDQSKLIYIYNTLDKLIIPDRIVLNERGYVRFSATILPFQKGDYRDGRIEIIATAEGEKSMDIGSGSTTLIYRIPPKFQKIIHIDAQSGEIN